MGLRQRERITRGSPDTGTCGACGDSSYEHNLSVKRVAGEYLHLCVTCRIELKHERLAEHLETKAQNQPDADVNTDLIQNIRDWRERESGTNVEE